MLKRNEVAIVIDKINRVTKVALKDNYATCPGEYRGVIERDFANLPLWAEQVRQFWNAYPTASLTEDILCLLRPSYLMTQYNTGGTVLERKHFQPLTAYNRIMSQLHADCEKLEQSSPNNKFAFLPSEIANQETLDLLEKGVAYGFLDGNYKPLSTMTPQQIKVYTYALATSLSLPKRCFWAPFESFWERDICQTPLPLLHQDSIKTIMNLFPKVDFEPLFKSDEAVFFTCPYNKMRIKTLYRSLLLGNFISPETRESQMMGLFGLNSDIEPVNWIQPLRHLAYFVSLAFTQNDNNVWIKTEARFLVNNQKPNVGTLKSSLSPIKKQDVWNTYNPQLKEIAETFNRPR